ncbi:type III secretion system export apparatus subunit SctU [Pseudomonas sp. MWU13-3659]|uniref:type III secretion system export apparatus subunit SctU n=1 Tax=Pseudomonas sp. MWU13-3659 TaxID=2986964 RepID=UPI0020763135|nr:type III secretion system export apparatus subunit SctU [Pseudomonas sp. MWU13-3659]
MSAEKTEQPTPKKLRDARKKGQVAKSKEVVSTALILSLVAVIGGFSDYFLRHLGALMLLPESVTHLPFRQAMDLLLEQMLHELLWLTLPFLVTAVVAVVLSHLVQIGFLFSGESIKLDIKKINPVEGAKKIFSVKNLLEFLKSMIKVALLATLVVALLSANLRNLLQMPTCGLGCILPMLGVMLKHLMLVCAIGFIVISVADYGLERWQHRKQLRMSKDEVKREHKEMEGSPEIKHERRRFHRELQSGSMREDVKRSSVIVTNPTHIAVGLRYQPGETPLPLVTLMYTEEQALMIRKIAAEEGVPVLERVPLARALYADGLVDQYIPGELIQPVAEVIRWLQAQGSPQ